MLEPRDHLAIEELYSRYNRASDSGDVAELADKYTEDGVFIGAGGVRVEGRAAFRAYMQERVAARARSGIRFQQHWITNLILEGDAQAATGFCYVVVIDEKVEGGTGVRNLGYYHDQLRKEGEKWLFERREYRPEPLPACT